MLHTFPFLKKYHKRTNKVSIKKNFPHFDVLNPQFSSISSLVSLFFTLIDCHESSDFVKTHHSSLEFKNELKTESSSIHSVS